MFPPAPAFRSVRLARLADLTRIGVVAAAGFFHSSVWPYERPFAADYANDTLASYRHMYQNAILDPNSIVLVSEAVLKTNEVDSVYAALAKVYPPWSDQLPPDALQDGKAVVGVASISLQKGSQRYGQFQPDGTSKPPSDPALRDRDRSPVATELYDKATRQAEQKWFKGLMEFDTIVVHPAYWGKGHAGNLTAWSVELADLDGVGIGVLAASMGEPLFKHIGFEHAETIEIPGYEHHPDPVGLWVGLRNERTADNALKTQL